MKRLRLFFSVLLPLLFLGAVASIAQDGDDPFGAGAPAAKKGGGEPPTVEAVMKPMIIPSVEFEDTPLDIVLEFLVVKSFELDKGEPDPAARGINIILKNADHFADVSLTLQLSNVPFYEALKIVAQLSGASLRLDPHAVVFELESAAAEGGKAAKAEPFEGDSPGAKKLRAITLPSIELVDTPLAVALDFLQSKSFELDANESDLNLKGISVRVEGGEAIIDRRISLNLWNVPLGTALRYVAELSDLEVSLEDDTVVFKPKALAGAVKPDGEIDDLVPEARVSLIGFSADGPAGYSGAGEEGASEPTLLEQKLERIVIPSIEFTDTPLNAALGFIEQKSQELDVETTDPAEKGINLVLKGGGDFVETPVNLKVSNVSLGQALNFVAQLAGAPLRIDRHAVVFEVPNGGQAGAGTLGISAEDQKVTEAKLKQISLPSVEFADTPLAGALEFLRMKSMELDSTEADPSRKGINVVLIDGTNGEDTAITLRLKSIPLGDALGYVAELAGLDLKVEGAAVVLRRKPDPGQ